MTGSPAEDHYHRKTLAREDYPAPWSRGGIRDLETEGERMGGWGGEADPSSSYPYAGNQGCFTPTLNCSYLSGAQSMKAGMDIVGFCFVCL